MPNHLGDLFGIREGDGVELAPGAPGTTFVTRTTIERRIHSYLSEPIGSPIAALGQSASATPIITTSDQMALVAWEAACSFCRACYAVPATGSATLGSGTTRAMLHTGALTVTSVGGYAPPADTAPHLWSVRANGVSLDGTPLTRLDAPVFEVLYDRATTAGTPLHWCRDTRNDVIRVGPPIAADGKTLTVEGYALPGPLLPLAADAKGFSYVIPDDLVLTAVCAHAAYLICEQQTDDVQLSARKAELVALVNEARMREWSRLPTLMAQSLFSGKLTLLQSAPSK